MRTTSEGKRSIALLLCWLLGIFGGHRFYVGKTASAVTMLVVSFTFVGLFVTAFWVLIDFITIAAGGFKDEFGATLSDW